MTRPTRYEWSREKLLVKERAGVHSWRIVYFCKLDESTVLNVWRSGGYWRYVTIALGAQPLIVAHGSGPTMHETKLRAENALGDNQPQQTLFRRNDHAAPF